MRNNSLTCPLSPPYSVTEQRPRHQRTILRRTSSRTCLIPFRAERHHLQRIATLQAITSSNRRLMDSTQVSTPTAGQRAKARRPQSRTIGDRVLYQIHRMLAPTHLVQLRPSIPRTARASARIAIKVAKAVIMCRRPTPVFVLGLVRQQHLHQPPHGLPRRIQRRHRQRPVNLVSHPTPAQYPRPRPTRLRRLIVQPALRRLLPHQSQPSHLPLPRIHVRRVHHRYLRAISPHPRNVCPVMIVIWLPCLTRPVQV